MHPDLFKGANRRFKVVPWNKMAGKQLERPLSESQWQVKISKEEQRRAARADKLKEMGYEFEETEYFYYIVEYLSYVSPSIPIHPKQANTC